MLSLAILHAKPEMPIEQPLEPKDAAQQKAMSIRGDSGEYLWKNVLPIPHLLTFDYIVDMTCFLYIEYSI